MLEKAKQQVFRFLAREKSLGEDSKVVKAFQLATGEPSLRFDWDFAQQKTRHASLDRKREIDAWSECFAMTSGSSNLQSEIFVCGTKKLTQRALNSLLCHEPGSRCNRDLAIWQRNRHATDMQQTCNRHAPA